MKKETRDVGKCNTPLNTRDNDSSEIIKWVSDYVTFGSNGANECNIMHMCLNSQYAMYHQHLTPVRSLGTVCSEKIAPALDHPNEMPTYRIFSPLFSDRLTT